MYKFNHSILLALLALLIVVTSCKLGLKGEDDPVLEEMKIVTEALHQSFFEFTVLGGTEDEPFRLENDGMHGIYGVSRTDADNLEGNNLSLFQCIRDVNPSLTQLLRIRTATNNFSDCRNASSQPYTEAIRKLIENLEVERAQILQSLQEGSLSLLEARAQFTTMRIAARAEVLAEKEKVSEQLKACLLAYMTEFNVILSPTQWTEFRACIVN